MAQTVKRLPTMQETWVQSFGMEDPLEKEMATHSSILAWKTPWTAAYQVPPSMGFSRQEDWRGVPSCSPVFTELFNFSFFSVTVWGIGLDYCDIECFALETNRDHSFIFEIASKYCISDSFVVYDGYSISSKGFLPTVLDIMVI